MPSRDLYRTAASRGISKLFLYPVYILTALLLVSLIRDPGIAQKWGGIISVSNFEGYRPFQYRIIMPLLVRGIEFCTPEPVVNKANLLVERYVQSHPDIESKSDPDNVHISPKYGYRVLIYILLEISIVTFYLIILRKFAGSLNIFSGVVRDLLPLGIAIAIPICYDFIIYPYDFLHLSLFATALYFLYKKSWHAYLAVFVLAILNKETAAFLIIIYYLNYRSDLPGRILYRNILIQVGIVFVIKSSLYYIFMDNPGTMAIWQLPENLAHLSSIGNYFRFQFIGKGWLYPYNLHFPLPRGVNLPLILVVGSLIWYDWKIKPRFLKVSLTYLIVLFCFAMAFGLINEIRAYMDAFTIIYLLAAIGFVRLWESRKHLINTIRIPA